MVWNETVTNITSITVAANQANGIGTGSNVRIYKLLTASGLADDAGVMDAHRAMLPHPQRIPKVQAGANITITENALGPIIASTGGGGGVTTFLGIAKWGPF
jgi:hypothetical protein